ncbi:MAG: glycosyltransferase family 2 protein [Planctomycetota bacterium]|nr:glycosyltransferase family 2 protein [Planctomycetota bacterium]
MEKIIKSSVIVPAYNEESGLPVVVQQLTQALDDSTEIVVVDDGSTDQTASVARQLPCRLISHPQNIGKGKAMQTGIANAKGENIIFIDADGTYPAEEINTIIEKLKEYEAVFTAREQQNIYLLNLIGNKLISFMIKVFSGFEGHDPLSGLYGVKKSVLEKMSIEANDFSVETEIVVKSSVMGFKITGLPIKYAERIGQSKLKPFKDGWKISKLIFSLLTIYNPLLTFIIPGTIITIIGLALFLLTLTGPITIFNNIRLDIHTFIFGVMAFLIGFQIIIQGVILDLYAVRHKYKRYDRISGLFKRRLFRWLFMLGVIIFIAGVVMSFYSAVAWVKSGFSYYFETRMVVFSLLLNLFGLQLIFSSLLGRVFTQEIQEEK